MPDGRLQPKAIAGPGAAKGYVLTWGGIEPKWAAPSGGGGLLGSAYVTFGFPNIPADGSLAQASSSAGPVIDSGTPAVSQSSGTITYCTDGVASYYLINAGVNWTGVTGGSATDIFRVTWNDWLVRFMSSGIGITDGATGPRMTQGGPLSGSGGMQPELQVTCPNGTGRTLTGVTLQYAILRFAV